MLQVTFFVGVDFAPNNTAHHKCKVYKEGFFSLNHAPDLGRRGFSMSATLPYVTTRYIGTPFLFSFLQKSDWQRIEKSYCCKKCACCTYLYFSHNFKLTWKILMKRFEVLAACAAAHGWCYVRRVIVIVIEPSPLWIDFLWILCINWCFYNSHTQGITDFLMTYSQHQVGLFHRCGAPF